MGLFNTEQEIKNDSGAAVAVTGTVTANTGLGQNRDSVAGATDAGTASLGVYEETPSHTTVAEGDYERASLTGWKETRTRDQRSRDIADCNDYTLFTTLGNDTANLANSANHVFGTAALTFDKVNGAANTVFAGVQDTITAIDISEIFEDGGYVGLACQIPNLTNVSYTFLRLGTDSSNYNEWRWTVDSLTAGEWMVLRQLTAKPSSYLGNGWDTNAITYVAFGVAFTGETNTLAGLLFDNVHLVGSRVTDSQVSSVINLSSTNINVARVGGSNVATSSGNKTNGTQRVTLADNDVLVTDVGDVSDAVVAAGAAGSVSAKLRRLTTDLDSVKTNTGNSATAANQTTELTRLGDVTETAPATDTASSGLNGRLQRIAQRITSLIALLPGSLGQKARASSFAVTLSTEDITALTPPAAITGYATQTTLASIDTNIALKLAPGKLRYTNIISASTTITPTSGKAIKVIKVQVVPSTDNSGAVQIYINFATSAQDVFKGYAGGGYGIFTGNVNEVLTITQTGTGNVQVLVDYNEI